MSDDDDIDFFRGNELIVDPYPYFDHLRAECPVLREPHHDVVMVTGTTRPSRSTPTRPPSRRATAVTGPFPGFPVPLEGDDVERPHRRTPRRAAVQRPDHRRWTRRSTTTTAAC